MPMLSRWSKRESSRLLYEPNPPDFSFFTSLSLRLIWSDLLISISDSKCCLFTFTFTSSSFLGAACALLKALPEVSSPVSKHLFFLISSFVWRSIGDVGRFRTIRQRFLTHHK